MTKSTSQKGTNAGEIYAYLLVAAEKAIEKKVWFRGQEEFEETANELTFFKEFDGVPTKLLCAVVNEQPSEFANTLVKKVFETEKDIIYPVTRALSYLLSTLIEEADEQGNKKTMINVVRFCSDITMAIYDVEDKQNRIAVKHLKGVSRVGRTLSSTDSFFNNLRRIVETQASGWTNEERLEAAVNWKEQ